MDWMPHFIPMVTVMTVAAMTPGPNNIMLAASGTNFGFRRTIPHMAGVVGGFMALVLLVGQGLDWLFGLSPLIQQGFRAMALGFILWLAWRIATSTSRAKAEGTSRPQYFYEAAGFQFINPKSLVMSTTIVSSFIRPDAEFGPQFAVLATSFFVIAAISVVVWAGFGVMISSVINTHSRLRAFNVTMAALLVASMLPVIRDLLLFL